MSTITSRLIAGLWLRISWISFIFIKLISGGGSGCGASTWLVIIRVLISTCLFIIIWFSWFFLSCGFMNPFPRMLTHCISHCFSSFSPLFRVITQPHSFCSLWQFFCRGTFSMSTLCVSGVRMLTSYMSHYFSSFASFMWISTFSHSPCSLRKFLLAHIHFCVGMAVLVTLPMLVFCIWLRLILSQWITIMFAPFLLT